MTKKYESLNDLKVSFYIEKDLKDNEFKIKKIVSLPLPFKISRTYTKSYAIDLLNLLLEYNFNNFLEKSEDEFETLFRSLPFNRKITFNFNDKRIEIGERENIEIIK
ncbi:MAG: hypothetical protein ACTSQP_11320 [Promethearchaeota archaeon]